MESKSAIQISLIALNCLIIGGFIGAGLVENPSNTGAQKVLEDYPLELTMAGLVRHDKVDTPETEAPSLDLKVHRDKMMENNFNLELVTEDFSFAPENISESHRFGKGHAHVYVNETLIGRAYSEWYHLPRLKTGEHKITVTLNTNDHGEYAVDGETISDSATVSVE